MQIDLPYIFVNQDICYSYQRNVGRYVGRDLYRLGRIGRKESFKLIIKINCIV